MTKDYLAYRSELEAHENRKDNPHGATAEQVGADPKGTAASVVGSHNTNTSAHNDIRILIEGLSARLNAALDSDDTALDQMSELVAYIKSNKALIDSITTSKVNVSDIINNLTTNVSNQPLSAAQGVALKALIDALQTEVDGKSDDGHKHAASDITSGTFGVARGGTGKASWTANRLIYPSTAATLAQLAFPTTAGSFLCQGTSGAPYWITPAQVLAAIGAFANSTTNYSGDCNSLTDGIWNVLASATNSLGIACVIIHKTWDSNFASQLAFGADQMVYERIKSSGTWTDWREFLVNGATQDISGEKHFLNEINFASTVKFNGSLLFSYFTQDAGYYNYPIEIGQFIDMHYADSTNDYDIRLRAGADGLYTKVYTDSSEKKVLTHDKIIAVYNAAVAFASGVGTYTNSAIKDGAICIVQRRASTQSVVQSDGLLFATNTTSGGGSVKVTSNMSTLNATVSLNIIIINP